MSENTKQGYKSVTVMVIIFQLIGVAVDGILICAAKDDFDIVKNIQEILDQKYRESNKRK